MTGPLTCGICSGPLTLRYSGGAPSLVSEAFAPSCHSLSGYGDLYACARCGTIQQPDLPKGRELHELYRNMRDDAYLVEEDGRRRTARRVLDAIERHGKRGRMLDVGCGHGLLLDEARARGWQVAGLEISSASRAHAAEDLGLDVRDATLDELDPATDGGYDAIVLADVLEHLDDPVAALKPDRAAARARRCGLRRHARPGVAHGQARRPGAGGAICALRARMAQPAPAGEPGREQRRVGRDDASQGAARARAGARRAASAPPRRGRRGARATSATDGSGVVRARRWRRSGSSSSGVAATSRPRVLGGRGRQRRCEEISRPRPCPAASGGPRRAAAHGRTRRRACARASRAARSRRARGGPCRRRPSSSAR